MIVKRPLMCFEASSLCFARPRIQNAAVLILFEKQSCPRHCLLSVSNLHLALDAIDHPTLQPNLVPARSRQPTLATAAAARLSIYLSIYLSSQTWCLHVPDSQRLQPRQQRVSLPCPGLKPWVRDSYNYITIYIYT